MTAKRKPIQKTPGYKGFYHDLTTAVKGRSKLLQWEEGKTVRLRSKAPPVPCTDKALHFCEEPSAVLQYYAPVEYGEKSKYAEVEAKGGIERTYGKTGCKALKIKKVFKSIWDFAKTFETVFNAVVRRIQDWTVIDSDIPIAGECNGGPILFVAKRSAVKSYYPVLSHGSDHNLIESASLALMLGGEQNMAVSSSCVIVRAEGDPVFAEVTSPKGIAVVLEPRYNRNCYTSRAYVRGVAGSTFIFLRSCASPVIVKVDDEKIKAGRYYYAEIDGTVCEDKCYSSENREEAE